jgi:hypothetical protein
MNIRSAQMHFIDSYQSMKETKGRQAAMVALGLGKPNIFLLFLL